jgi:hypothetical protein
MTSLQVERAHLAQFCDQRRRYHGTFGGTGGNTNHMPMAVLTDVCETTTKDIRLDHLWVRLTPFVRHAPMEGDRFSFWAIAYAYESRDGTKYSLRAISDVVRRKR